MTNDELHTIKIQAGSHAAAEAIQKGHTPRFYRLAELFCLCENILEGRQVQPNK